MIPMENKTSTENTTIYKGLSKVEQYCFLTMTKEEIIEKYIELKANWVQAEKDIGAYRKYAQSLLKELQLFKVEYPDLNKDEYNPKWSWVNKIVFVLKKTRRPMLSPEIIRLLVPHEPILQHSSNRPQAFSVYLNKAVKYQRIAAYKRGGSRGYYYVLPEWMNEHGVLEKQYEDKIFFK